MHRPPGSGTGDHEVIDQSQFSGYNAERQLRWQDLLTHYDARELSQRGQLLMQNHSQERALFATFIVATRLAAEVSDRPITWTPGQLSRIHACMLIHPAMSIPSCWKSCGID
jgi:hypothetical protein